MKENLLLLKDLLGLLAYGSYLKKCLFNVLGDIVNEYNIHTIELLK